MAEQDGRDDEINALMQVEGIDTAKIAAQVSGKKGDGKPHEEQKKPDEKKPDEKPPDDKKPDNKNAPDPEAIKTGMLNEMFGDQFKTVEDVKKANIPEALRERETLRQKNLELETQLKAKPKTQFVNEDIAKLNEFIRETGIKDVGIFNKLNGVDVAKMDDIDVLVTNHIIENPRLASKDPQVVRKYFETKYNVDPAKVEAGDLTSEQLEYNKMELEAQADKARVKLLELKGKIKMPEPPKEEPPEGGKPKWTPEIETQQKTVWNKVNDEMVKTFANLPIRVKGFKDPVANFVVPEEAKAGILKTALDYIVSNQLEANEANIKAVAKSMYSKLKDDFEEEILHTLFERARSMTQEEYLKTYSNPSGKKNNDTPPGGGEELSDEAKRERAYRAELER